MMNKIRRVFEIWGRLWWQGMRLHARHVCRDEAEAMERIRWVEGRQG